MNQMRIPRAPKGQFKCFHCRALTRSKDGAWHELVNQQVFLCKPCETVHAKAAPVAADFTRTR
ncbi:MAG: hypothetical protein NDJ90_15400 [Oligoflexia bacterium]|nr:hypothetical protein [Oligoflexia bacterium]